MGWMCRKIKHFNKGSNDDADDKQWVEVDHLFSDGLHDDYFIESVRAMIKKKMLMTNDDVNDDFDDVSDEKWDREMMTLWLIFWRQFWKKWR